MRLYICTVTVLYILVHRRNDINCFQNAIKTEHEHMKEALPCLLEITRHYCLNTNFLFIKNETLQISFIGSLLSRLEGTYMILEENNFREKSGFFIFFPHRDTSYVKILNELTPSMYNRFLIIWPYLLPNSTHVLHFVSQFWDLKLINVLILAKKTKDSYNIYTYDPYSPVACNKPANLRLLDVWDASLDTFLYSRDFYQLTKQLTNLNGCKLVCFAKTRPPDAIVIQDAKDNWRLEGIGGKLFEEIRKHINFTPVIEVPKLNVSSDKYGYDISEGYPEVVSTMLHNYEVDLAFGIYSHIIYDNPKVEFSVATSSECFGWAVPAHGGKAIPLWKYYTEEFNLCVWILIILIFLLNVVIFYYMNQLHESSRRSVKTICHSMLYVFALHLGTSATPRIKPTLIRIFFSLSLLYFLIISSAYQSSLGSFLTVPWQRENIKTYTEIFYANYNVIGIPQSKRILQRFATNDSIGRNLSSKYVVYKDHFESVVKQIQANKDTATFGPQRFIQFYITNELNSTGREDVYLLPKCVIKAHASPFLFKKGSPLMTPINKIISYAVESGLIDYWYTFSTPKTTRPVLTQYFPLTMQQLRCAFVMLLLGNGMACVAFAIELFRTEKNLQKHGE